MESTSQKKLQMLKRKHLKIQMMPWTLENGNRLNNNVMEEANDNMSVGSDYVIESVAKDPKAFTFNQITMSSKAAAL